MLSAQTEQWKEVFFLQTMHRYWATLSFFVPLVVLYSMVRLTGVKWRPTPAVPMASGSDSEEENDRLDRVERLDAAAGVSIAGGGV